MKWVLLHQSSEHHRWTLLESEKPAMFIYNLQHHSIRIKAHSLRLFFLEASGFFNKKVLLRSEYGVVIGEAQLTPASKAGSLLMNNEKYFYKWIGYKLSLYNKARKLLSETKIEYHKNTDVLEKFSFIFNAAWMADAVENNTAAGLLVA